MSGNPIRGRANALLLRRLDESTHELFGRRKQVLFKDLPELVVEIGPGSGSNFRYYRPGTSVIAIEPNRHLSAALRASADRYKVNLSIIDATAERLPLPDASVEAVVCTLVLCTVPDQDLALREISRVLRPGGRLVFLEHVRAPARTMSRWLQVVLRRPWRWMFEGCDLTRDTETALRKAGFARVDADRYVTATPLLMINCQICGSAQR